MQRVYGVTFPDKEKLADYKMRMEEAKKRDHRTQGVKQELFFFDKLSPGSCFFMPHGARIYMLLIEVGYKFTSPNPHPPPPVSPNHALVTLLDQGESMRREWQAMHTSKLLSMH